LQRFVTIDAVLQCFGRTRSQNIIPCVMSNGGTIVVGMKNAAPSILGSIVQSGRFAILLLKRAELTAIKTG
jgi:hypothetical protein